MEDPKEQASGCLEEVPTPEVDVAGEISAQPQPASIHSLQEALAAAQRRAQPASLLLALKKDLAQLEEKVATTKKAIKLIKDNPVVDEVYSLLQVR